MILCYEFRPFVHHHVKLKDKVNYADLDGELIVSGNFLSINITFATIVTVLVGKDSFAMGEQSMYPRVLVKETFRTGAVTALLMQDQFPGMIIYILRYHFH